MLTEEIFNQENTIPGFTYDQYVEQHKTRFNLEPDDIVLDYIRSKLLQKIKGKEVEFTQDELKILFDLSNY